MILGKILLLAFLFNLIIGFCLLPIQTLAASPCQPGITVTYNPPQPIPEGSSFDITFRTVDPGNYQFRVGWGAIGAAQTATTNTVAAANGSVTLTMSDSHVLDQNNHTGTLVKDGSDYCGDVTYKVGYQYTECTISFRPSTIKTTQDFQVDVHHAKAGNYTIRTAPSPSVLYRDELAPITIGANGEGSTALIHGYTSPQALNVVMFRQATPFSGDQEFCGQTPLVVAPIGAGVPVPVPPPGAPGPIAGGGPPVAASGEACHDGTANGVLTAIGCVPTNPVELIQGLMKFFAGVAGAIALLLMVSGSIQMMTSSGNPDGIKKGRDQFVYAAAGLLFVILSVTILQIIGVDILNLPGFGK